MNAEALAVTAATAVLWLLVSKRAERANISSALALTVAGMVLATGPLAIIEVDLRAETVRTLAEATLALVLFGDASRVRVRSLRRDVALPARLLSIGLPLTILLGVAIATLNLPGTGFWVAALIACIVAPTDAALGAPILVDRRVPEGVRRALNVESGLNDGIATPFVNLCLAAALVGEVGAGQFDGGLRSAVSHLVIGALVGMAVGLGGGLLVRAEETANLLGERAARLVVLFLAGLSFTAALGVDGNGFIAAFVGGLAYGSTSREQMAPPEERSTELNDEVAEAMSLLVWFVFGAALLVPAIRGARWSDLVFAVLALTLVRMVPVALALLGSGTDRATVLFVGWFGPRGLASVVFLLIAIDALDPADGTRVLSAVSITIALSILAHGVSASPLARRYGNGRAAPGSAPSGSP